MIRITRQADYAILLMTRFSVAGDEVLLSASDLASRTGLSSPITMKLLKALARGGLVQSLRGVHGGYRLARPPEDITLADIIAAVEGPISLTSCHEPGAGTCSIEARCPTRVNWGLLNQAVRQTLEAISLRQMSHPVLTPSPIRTRPNAAAAA